MRNLSKLIVIKDSWMKFAHEHLEQLKESSLVR